MPEWKEYTRMQPAYLNEKYIPEYREYNYAV